MYNANYLKFQLYGGGRGGSRMTVSCDAQFITCLTWSFCR